MVKHAITKISIKNRIEFYNNLITIIYNFQKGKIFAIGFYEKEFINLLNM